MCTDLSVGFGGYWNPCLPTLVAIVGVPKAPEGKGCEASVGLQEMMGIVGDHPSSFRGAPSVFCEVTPFYRLQIKVLGKMRHESGLGTSRMWSFLLCPISESGHLGEFEGVTSFSAWPALWLCWAPLLSPPPLAIFSKDSSDLPMGVKNIS